KVEPTHHLRGLIDAALLDRLLEALAKGLLRLGGKLLASVLAAEQLRVAVRHHDGPDDDSQEQQTKTVHELYPSIRARKRTSPAGRRCDRIPESPWYAMPMPTIAGASRATVCDTIRRKWSLSVQRPDCLSRIARARA